MCDYVFKILIVGDVGVCKSFLFGRFLEDRFSKDYNSTVGTEFNVCQAEAAGKMMLLLVKYTAGEECFHAMLPSYSNVHGVIIVAAMVMNMPKEGDLTHADVVYDQDLEHVVGLPYVDCYAGQVTGSAEQGLR